MDSTARLSETVRLEIDRASSDFESALHSGHAPAIEHYLVRFEGSDLAKQQLFRRLLQIEVQAFAEQGERLPESRYAARFPAYAPEIAHLFAEHEATDDWETEPADSDRHTVAGSSAALAGEQPPPGDSEPVNVGKYKVIRRLGEGRYGVVYLAWHPQLQKEVAIKCPREDGSAGQREIERFIVEAKTAASLKHPAIVSIFDVDCDGDRPFIVQEYIPGRDLRETLRQGTLEPPRIAALLADVAEAAAHAHEHDLYHRDLAPSNILLDSAGGVFVTDFGLAMHEAARNEHRGEKCGTPRYMAPEQVRGESHRLDGRSDIWSIGVMLYEMLAGVHPFSAADRDELSNQILYDEPRPPRQIRPQLPAELERICLRCLSKKMTDRYPTARDLAADLRAWVATSASPRAAPAGAGKMIVPKGLRAFQEQDADFYLELVPGPRDRDGLPLVVRDWKLRIEETDPDRAFSIGVLYGPSGSGKSSLLHAGLLPRLSRAITTVTVEAAADNIESRVLRELRKRIPTIPPELPLPDVFAGLRNREWAISGHKTLVVVDQLEQWLHSTTQLERSSFLHALRQCDGSCLQAMVLVRDDFWMGVTQVVNELEPALSYTAAVDHFDCRHARKVLTQFGQAYGVLPEDAGQVTADQTLFLEASIRELSQNERVACVRLSVFAEMLKDRPWVPATLERAGGVRGIGESFLDAAFCSPAAAPRQRLHAVPAQKVLEQLLPEAGINIRGHTKPRRDLQAAAELDGRDREFDELLGILDADLHLITPTDPCADESAAADTDHGYQLTHDYLIPALRQWLHRQQRKTPAGKARIKLVERAALWRSLPEGKQLPSLREWLSIRTYVPKRIWSAEQALMMRSADRHHLSRLAALTVLLICAALGGWLMDARLRQRDQIQRVDSLLKQLWSADLEHLPGIVDELDAEPDTWRERVEALGRDPSEPLDARLRAHLALARSSRSSAQFLHERLPFSHDDEYQVITHELGRWRGEFASDMWRTLLAPRPDPSASLRIAGFLAQPNAQGDNWRRVADQLVADLLACDPLELRVWVTRLHPIRRQLIGPLLAAFRDPLLTNREGRLAASIVAEFSRRDTELLSDRTLVALALESSSQQFEIMFRRLLELDRTELAQQTAEQLEAAAPDGGPDDEQAVHRKANAAEILLRIGRQDLFWPLLQDGPDPRLRTALIGRIYRSRVDWVEAFAFSEDSSIRQAVLLGIDEAAKTLPRDELNALRDWLLQLYETDADPAVHSAAEWLLRRLGQQQAVAHLLNENLRGDFDPAARNWFVNNHGQTMVMIPPPGVFHVGASEDPFGSRRIDSQAAETQEESPFAPLREAQLDHSFAIGAHEVTVEQYLQFDPDFEFAEAISPDARCPMNRTTWYDAAKYCRWLSEQEGIPESEMCYPPIGEIGEEMEALAPDFYLKQGYRLPTELEWEYAVRGRSRTARFFGNSDTDLARYSWFSANSQERTWPVGMMLPNSFGLFDVYGNVREWCHASPAAGAADANGDDAVRGGSYRHTPSLLRSAGPAAQARMEKYSTNGFRLVKTLARAMPPGN